MEMLQVTRKNNQAPSFSWGPLLLKRPVAIWEPQPISQESCAQQMALNKIYISVQCRVRGVCYQCRPASSSSVTCNAQVLSSLPCHYSATSLALKLLGSKYGTTHIMQAQSHGTPKNCGFSLVWACVWSVLSKTRWDQACCPICGDLRHGKQRTGWMICALTTRHGCFIDRGKGAMQHDMYVLHHVVLTLNLKTACLPGSSQGSACTCSQTAVTYLAGLRLHL